MTKINSPIVQESNNFGAVELRLKEYLAKRGINRNELAKATGINYKVLTSYYNTRYYLGKLDMGNISRICYVLECEMHDILQYHRDAVPEELA